MKWGVMRRIAWFLLISFFALALSACCAPRNMFVLLPNEDGTVGQITVANDKGSQVLAQPFQATGMNSPNEAPRSPLPVTPQRIESLFGKTLAAQPLPPKRFILYFEPGSTELTRASRELLTEVLQTIARRQSVDNSVVGHSDTVGDAAFNLKLSRERAQGIAQLLIDRGVDQGILEVTSHGEGNLLVPTADNVAEPRNRRVEITVR